MNVYNLTSLRRFYFTVGSTLRSAFFVRKYESWQERHPSVDLHVEKLEVDGKESAHGNVIIILHGMLGSSRNWATLGRQLYQAFDSKYEVLIPDSRNHGRSPWSSHTSYLDMASDILSLIYKSKHHKSDITLIGHSMGARTAMVLALLEPNLISRLIAVDSSPVHYFPATDTGSTSALLKKLSVSIANCPADYTLAQGRKYVDDNLMSSGVKDVALRQWLLTMLIMTDHGLDWQFNLPILAKAVDTEISKLPLQVLNQKKTKTTYNHPTLIIGGQRSKYVPQDEKGKSDIREVFTEAEVVHIESADHWVHVDQPKKFMNLCIKFLRACQR